MFDCYVSTRCVVLCSIVHLGALSCIVIDFYACLLRLIVMLVRAVFCLIFLR